MAKTEGGYDELANLSNFISRVNEAYAEYQAAEDFVTFYPDNKDDDEARQYIREGDEMFYDKAYEAALKLYTRAMALAVKGSNVLAEAFVHRAMVLLTLGYVTEYEEDVKRANENRMLRASKRILKKVQRKFGTCSSKRQVYRPPVPTIPSAQQNERIKCATNAIEIRENRRYGRHVIATRDIAVGEVIAVEESFALFYEDASSVVFCSECTKLSLNLIHCDGCSEVMFCGLECKQKSVIHHQYECAIMRTIRLNFEKLKSDFGKHFSIALRMILEHKKIMLDANAYTVDTGTTEGSTYYSNRFSEILRLSTNFELQTDNRLQFIAHHCAVVCDLLEKHSELFTEYPNQISNDIFKGLLMKLTLVSITNFRENTVTYREQSEAFPSNTGPVSKTVVVGIRGNSFMSLLNYSCSPNVLCVGSGNTLILLASADIQKGDQLFDTHLTYYDVDKEDRHVDLNHRYRFNCNCKACVENWPTMEQLETVDKDSCATLESILDDCKKNVKVIEENLEKAFSLPRHQWRDPSKERALFDKRLRRMYSLLYTESRDITEINNINIVF